MSLYPDPFTPDKWVTTVLQTQCSQKNTSV